MLLNGFAREISGQPIGYHSCHPYATQALITRCTDGKHTIAWETDPVPASSNEPFVTFVWIAGHSTGSSQSDGQFRLAINGQDYLSFTTVKDRRVRQWTVSGKVGVELSFDAQSEDSANDLFGYAFLKVPSKIALPGQALNLSITGDALDKQTWFMTFKHAFRDSLEVKPEPALLHRPQGTAQALDVLIDHLGTSGQVEIQLPGQELFRADLKLGLNRVHLFVDPVKERKETTVAIRRTGLPEQSVKVTLEPVSYREFWLIPHSHNDIGYSHLQSEVEKIQIQNLRDAVRLFKETANYPEEARSRWNSEILWAVESYLKTCSEEERKDFIETVRKGGIGLNATFANQLTGICRPEELLRLTDYARKLRKEFGVTIDDAMITDIPGSTWGTVTALAQAGIKYFSSGPNLMPFIPILGDRVGHFNLTWADKAFYWVSPSGQEKVLFWVAGKGYSWFADWIIGRAGPMTATHMFDYLRDLEKQQYPFDMVQLRYTVRGDNGPVDPNLPAFVKAWNEQYASPKLVIATNSQMFHEFEKRWGKEIPSYAGEVTPYWEDGALSTLRELGLVRHASERLVQAEALACIRPVNRNIRDDFYTAWRSVNLFDEHTWGAHNSIGEPESPFVIAQWKVKQQFALDADRQSRELMVEVLASQSNGSSVEVVNTLSWRRSDLVTLSAEQVAAALSNTTAGRGIRNTKEMHVVDDAGKLVPSQRLSTGELAFLATDVPPMGGKKYTVRPGPASSSELPAVGKYNTIQQTPIAGNVSAAGNVLKNSEVTVTLDQATGAIRSLKTRAGQELVDPGKGLNQYLYVAGYHPDSARSSYNSKIEVIESGPLVGKLHVTSEAPGSRSLVQEITLVHGSPRVHIRNVIDKLPIREKEGVHIAFPFGVPSGTWRMDCGWGVLRPETDQLPGSCKDFFSSGRWIDLSNEDHGVTLALFESPLVELGAITDETPVSRMYRLWRTTVASGNTVYSYLMNNYWHTNFAASQEGPTEVHYALIPHGAFDAVKAYKNGVERSQPLLVRQTIPKEPAAHSLFEISSPEIVVTSLMPSEDGKATMMRLHNPGEKASPFDIKWLGFKPKKITVSSLEESPGDPVKGKLSLPPFGILTLRCER